MRYSGDDLDVLVDLTPLDSAVRYRGIGRYVASLGAALGALAHDERAGLSLSALTGVVRARIDSAFGWHGDPLFRTYPGCHHVYGWKRRLFLDGAVARTRARLWHQTDPTGAPLRATRPHVATCFDLIPLVMHETYLAGRGGGVARQLATDLRRYGRAARVIAISEATRRDLVEQLGLDPDVIDVVPLGVDTRLFRPNGAAGEAERVCAVLGVERPFVLYVGGGDERKNLVHLVDAYALAGVASDVDLVVMGDLHRTQQPRVLEAIERGHVTGSVHLVGYVGDPVVAAAYRACLVHACPSLYEGFGLTVAESLASGAATLTTARGSLAEVAGDAALLVGGTDVEETASGLRRLVSDGALRADLGRRGVERAAEYRWSRTARETVASYRRALDSIA